MRVKTRNKREHSKTLNGTLFIFKTAGQSYLFMSNIRFTFSPLKHVSAT